MLLTPLGEVTLRPVRPGRDGAMLHAWLTHPRSHFWDCQDASEEDIRHEYTDLDAWIISLDGEDIALLERYVPAESVLKDLVPHLPAGTMGMHFLVAPPRSTPRPGLTRTLFSTAVRWMLEDAPALVVEPDERNEAILAMNKLAGFRDLPGYTQYALPNKTARVQLLERGDFLASRVASLSTTHTPVENPARVTGIDAAERELIAKMLREFIHERLLSPRRLADGYTVQVGPHILSFQAEEHALEHLSIDPNSIACAEGPLPALTQLVADAAEALEIPEHFRATYLGEISATLAGQRRIRQSPRQSSAELADPAGDTPAQYYLRIESAMTQGHPSFLANAGRDGMSESDILAYAPEFGAATRLVWLAARKELAVEAISEDPQLAGQFSQLCAGVPDGYTPIPVHPWQWEHRIVPNFSDSLASGDLVFLGEGTDLMRPQQSLRTFFNASQPLSPYVKTAVAVRNMGFTRGLSPEYMRDTPRINDWLHQTLGSDPIFRQHNVRLLREFAATGFVGDVYHGLGTKNEFTKMLAGLWRESPIGHLPEGAHAVTLAAILHRDSEGNALVEQWIKRSGLDAAEWVRRLLRVYLTPVLRALLAHDIVFMPHSENVVVELTDFAPSGSFFKDLGEEAAVVRHSTKVPVPRMQADDGSFTDAQRALSVHTDVLDGVLRHVAALLDDASVLHEPLFWQLVRECVEEYPGDTSSILVPEFRHSCLNRLQLKNPLTMVELGDQESSLLYAGTIRNPLA
ncbi:GNAT family N-acetyltransferase [Corynebacterium tapiri]|uniref:Lysine N-acyltransferase MbtK n=1 Tax=Corynebacterium tapiri TaxID=1448266 RepID=A0A5C4U600_9CORY|nr:GNAT family N-acetyltransferase [Corynebacterium tapiri]TNL98548.1 GNAT family N-acetyltransferase [Corynebacterium tapiri]